MKKFALIGNIASGKSVAFDFIKGEGIPIIDCDNIVNELYFNEQIAQILQFNFPEIFTDGSVDKKKIRNLIFSDENNKWRFESIIFPYVKAEIEKFFIDNSDKEIAFVVIPLLYEANMEKLFDKVVLIYADDNLRKSRLAKRNSLLSDYADKVMSAQISQDEKAKLCDFIIKNNGTLDEFQCAIKDFLKNL